MGRGWNVPQPLSRRLGYDAPPTYKLLTDQTPAKLKEQEEAAAAKEASKNPPVVATTEAQPTTPPNYWEWKWVNEVGGPLMYRSIWKTGKYTGLRRSDWATVSDPTKVQWTVKYIYSNPGKAVYVGSGSNPFRGLSRSSLDTNPPSQTTTSGASAAEPVAPLRPHQRPDGYEWKWVNGVGSDMMYRKVWKIRKGGTTSVQKSGWVTLTKKADIDSALNYYRKHTQPGEVQFVGPESDPLKGLDTAGGGQ
jgi:hypothetical protein